MDALRRLIKQPYAPWIAGGIVVVILVSSAGIWLVDRHKGYTFPADPHQGTIVATSRLLTTVTKLRQSFKATDGDASPRVTKQYLTYMNDIDADCRALQAYKQTLPSGNLTAVFDQYLASSAALCDDLSKVAANSQRLYVALQPVLSIDSHLKRYESIQPFAGQRRKHDIKAITTAQDAVQAPADALDFSTVAVPKLDQLADAVKASRGLAYYHQLAGFQQTMLIERQRYWISYGDVAHLQTALGRQLLRYCQTWQASGPYPAECKNLKVT